MKESGQQTGTGVAVSAGASAEEQIRMRAYELYRDRGGRVGDDMADWLRAEREYLENAPRITADPAGKGSSASVLPRGTT